MFGVSRLVFAEVCQGINNDDVGEKQQNSPKGNAILKERGNGKR